ncbi:unnamed protein product [Cuscuta epithymum]|uniref:Uncharacterized protein n=1 Tax=Cuscuta epithymum TaxID=186058 RepID=A0AAV0DT88_9ASTE|nr:unnamed protein product [Cuscuta epithymum]
MAFILLSLLTLQRIVENSSHMKRGKYAQLKRGSTEVFCRAIFSRFKFKSFSMCRGDNSLTPEDNDLKMPMIFVVLGKGGSEGAMAFGGANNVPMLLTYHLLVHDHLLLISSLQLINSSKKALLVLGSSLRLIISSK